MSTTTEKPKVIKSSGLVIPVSTDVAAYVDEQELSARAVITTAREDREGDIIIPTGCQTTDYQNNPVVLWGHGLEGVVQPIAKCVDPSGNLAIQVEEEQVLGKSYFTEKDMVSYQIFHLIAEGLVRATSVQALPVEFEARKASNGGSGFLVKVWELIEWSWCAIGMNPDAIAKVLDVGKIEGDRIAEPILKSLQAVAPEPVNFFKGISLPKESKVAEETTTDPVENDEKSTVEKAGTEPGAGEEVVDDEPVDQELEKMDTMEEDTDAPYGSKVLASIHRDICSMRDNMKAALKAVEQPDVKQAIEDMLEVLGGRLQEVEGTHSKVYPDRDGLAAPSDDESDEAMKAAQKSLAAWFATTGNSNRLAGIRSRIKTLAENSKLTAVQKSRGMVAIYKDLQSLESEALACEPVDYQKQIDGLVEHIDVLEQKIADIAPA